MFNDQSALINFIPGSRGQVFVTFLCLLEFLDDELLVGDDLEDVGVGAHQLLLCEGSLPDDDTDLRRFLSVLKLFHNL